MTTNEVEKDSTAENEKDTNRHSSTESELRDFDASETQVSDDEQGDEQDDQMETPFKVLPDLPDDVYELKKLVTLKAQEADQSLDDQKRTLAEFANYRKRMAKEALESRERGGIDLLLALAPALDDLEQAVKTAANSDKEQLQKGLELLQQKFRSLLASKGIEVIGLNGQPYDPEIAEALATIAVPGVEPNHVVETYSPAYKHKNIVIRHAKVVVTPSE
jgi:molecular chaperone GrpE